MTSHTDIPLHLYLDLYIPKLNLPLSFHSRNMMIFHLRELFGEKCIFLPFTSKVNGALLIQIKTEEDIILPVRTAGVITRQ